METTIGDILRELAKPPILVYPDWDTVADNSCPFHRYCDASLGGFGVTLEQEQPDGSVRSILYISRLALDSECSWTPLDLEAESIVGAIERLRDHLWSTKFRIYSNHKALGGIAKVGEHNARVRRWLEFLSAYTYTLEDHKGTTNGNADFLSCLSQPATEADRTGRNRLTVPDTVGIYLIRPCGFTPCQPSVPGIGLGGLVAPPSRPIPSPPPLPPTTSPTFASSNHTWNTSTPSLSLSCSQHLCRVYYGPQLCRRTASVPREIRRGHRRSSWLGVQAARRLLAIHHWRHDLSPFGSDLFSDPSPCRRRRGNSPSHRLLWRRSSATTQSIQNIYTHPQRASTTNQGPAEVPLS